MPKIPSEVLQQLKDIDLRELARRYTTLSGQGKELYGPCPRCGGRDRLHIQQSVFFCRQCLPPEAGKGRHDVVDFLVWIGEARNFREAVDMLSSSIITTLSPVRPVPSTPELKVMYELPEWQKHARQAVDLAHTLLLSEQGGLGQAYLLKRGLTPESWQTARLGLCPRLDSEGRRKSWSISIPWYYEDKLTAIQYRFIAPRSQRYTRYQYGGCYGETLLYTTLPTRGGSTILVCEGELNAISVWQATSSKGYDIISVGSMNLTQRTLVTLKKQVEKYSQIKVWTDEPSTSAALLEAFGRGEIVVADGDANDLLQQGKLQEVFA